MYLSAIKLRSKQSCYNQNYYMNKLCLCYINSVRKRRKKTTKNIILEPVCECVYNVCVCVRAIGRSPIEKCICTCINAGLSVARIHHTS